MLTIRYYRSSDHEIWDNYVRNHPNGTLYHLSGWKNVIEKTYGHKSYYLMALANSNNLSNPTNHDNCIVGILPLVHMKHFLFGNSLVSIPFFDTGGILADDEETERFLLSHAVKLAQELKAKTIEFRHIEPLPWFNSEDLNEIMQNCRFRTLSHKVRMLLTLPESPEILMKSFKSKLRSQIRKPLKEGLISRIGRSELLCDFYEVFSKNMRDLGSPVHSKKLMGHALKEFSDKASIVIIYKDKKPIACSFIVGFGKILENPWASALRKCSRLAPNMLLYWTMLEYACNHGYSSFDFGRSSPDEGTYKFKKQWGAKPRPLHWHYISLNGQVFDEQSSEKSKFAKAIHYWQKLPVSLTKIIGPPIRKHIGL